jgi:indole-3-glycerol phosphate synthase/phosphoribosylanthranilate isomerase
MSGAIYGGLIFVPTSPRAVNDAQAKAVIAAAPLQYVGVFRNAPLDEVVARAQAWSWPPYSCTVMKTRPISTRCATPSRTRPHLESAERWRNLAVPYTPPCR